VLGLKGLVVNVRRLCGRPLLRRAASAMRPLDVAQAFAAPRGSRCVVASRRRANAVTAKTARDVNLQVQRTGQNLFVGWCAYTAKLLRYGMRCHRGKPQPALLASANYGSTIANSI
jgi:hypothetical protein